MSYWKIIYTLADRSLFARDEALAEIEYQLMDGGAAGVYAEEAGIITAFIEAASSDEAAAFALAHLLDQFSAYTIESVPETNWTQSSTELLEQITIKDLTIMPVTDADAAARAQQLGSPSAALFIIPGMGFGTGHHATTKTVMQHLQSSQMRNSIQQWHDNSTPLRILDFGTGSGILALAARRLFPDALLHAVDNDPAAIDNARENAQINNMTDITFEVDDRPRHQADIIIANIYAELLQQFEPDFHQQLTAVGMLITSGIMQEKASLMDSSFPTQRWELLDSTTVDGWMTRMYRKKG
jgi:ribosomal protein L11 methyltransferase